MKKIYALVIAALLVVTAQHVSAQNNTDDGFSQLIKSSPADATKLVQAFAEPLFKGFGTGLNGGWNNTAQTKGLFRFDLRLTASGAFVPVSDKTFDVTQIGLSSHLRPADPSKTIAPTFGGAKVDGPVMRIYDDNGNPTTTTFTLPKGISSIVPAPAVQLTIGLVANTDVTLRTIPTLNLGDVGKVGMLGFGVKHNFTGSGLPALIPVDLALAFNYNRLTYSKALNVQPSGTAAVGAASDYSNQRINATVNGINVQAIISKKLLFFTPFLSLGYQSASTQLDVLGNYPIQSTVVPVGNVYTSVKDPVHIDETSVSGMRADLGFQLNLAIFRFYASGSVGKYPSVNGGIGFGF